MAADEMPTDLIDQPTERTEVKETEVVSYIDERRGDLMRFVEDYAVQQCNCLTTTSKGLAEAFARHLAVDAYADRVPLSRGSSLAKPSSRPAPGSYQVIASTVDPKKRVVCVFGQVAPGKASDDPQCHKYYARQHQLPDSRADRLRYLEMGLRSFLQDAVLKGEKPKTLALPKLIGCALAGGNVAATRSMLERVATDFQVRMVLYVQ